MLSQTYIALLTALGGIVLGFLLGQIGEYLRATREDKRLLKQVLFNQLDIWVEIKRADVETLVPLLVGKFQQALLKRGAQPEQVREMFAISLSPLIDLLRDLKLAAPEKLRERYQDSVNQLAKVDPLLAYQLSGRPQTDLNETVDAFIEKAVELEGEKARAASRSDAVIYFSNFLKGYGQHRMLSNMESDIVDVARKISYLTAFRTRRVIEHLTAKLAGEADKYMDEFLDSLIMHVAGQNPSGPSVVEEPSPEQPTEMKMKKGTVAFVDFLGQRGIWERHSPGVVLANIQRLRDIVRQHQGLGRQYLGEQFKAGAPEIKIEAIFVSDTMCIVCWYESPDDPRNKLCALVYMLGKVIANLIREAALIDPPRSLRGCISVGNFDFSDDILIGEAVDEAARYHESADGAFTFLTPSAQDCQEEAAKEGGMNDEELSLFIQYEVPIKEKAKTAGKSYNAPSLNPLAGETQPEQEKIVGRMIQSFDVSDEDVQRKKANTKAFLDIATRAVPRE